MKRKQVSAAELDLLRKRIEARYRNDGGKELEWKSYLPRYNDLNERIRSRIYGQADAAISANILRRLFWETRDDAEATFNIVYLNALARYISEGHSDYRELCASALKADQGASPLPVNPNDPGPEHGPGHDPSDPAEGSADPIRELVSEPPKEMGLARQSVPAAITVPRFQAPALGVQRSSPFIQPFLTAALYSGLLSFAFVLLFNEISGYAQLQRDDLRRLMISWFGFAVFGHLGLALALSFFTRKLILSQAPRRFFRAFLLTLPLLFLVIFYTRQLFVSSGWLVNGRAAVGFFGKPDFETTAIALSLCLFITLFLRAVHEGPGRPLQRAAFATLCCGTVFFVISAAYNILVAEGLIDPSGYFISATFFSFRFPHPERLPLICFMVFIQMFLTLKFVGAQTTDNASVPDQGRQQAG